MNSRLSTLQAKAAQARESHAYRAEGASIRFTEELVSRMKSCGVTRSALAEKIGTSPAYITKILRGETNFTLDTMVKVADALGCELIIDLRPTAKSASIPQAKVSYRQTKPSPSSMLNDQP